MNYRTCEWLVSGVSSLVGRQFLLRKESLGAIVAFMIAHLKGNVEDFVNYGT